MTRLTNWHKKLVDESITNLLHRLELHAPFPWPGSDEDARALLDSATDSTALRLMRELSAVAPGMVDATRYHTITVDETHSVRVEVVHWAAAHTLMPSHPSYDTIKEWCVDTADNKRRLRDACRVFDHTLEMSKTPGQLVRALPFITTFLPGVVAKELASAVRRSRLPAVDFDVVNRQSCEHLHNTLALAQLLPTDRAQNSRWYRA